MKIEPEALLRDTPLRKTQPRLRLLEVLLEFNAPMTEREILDRLGDDYDRVTFYRTVGKLEEANVLHRIVIDNLTIKYALNQTHHHCEVENMAHFYCIKCHKVMCMDFPKIDCTLPAGCTKVGCEILVKGICTDCNRD